VYVAAGRVALHWSQSQARRRGEALRPTLIVGAGRIGRLTAKRLLEQPELGLRPVGFLDKEPLDAEDGGAVLPVLGASWDLDRVVEEHGVEQVIVTFSTAPDDVLLRLFRRCEELGTSVAFVPRLFEKITGRLTVDYLGGLPVLSARAPDPRGLQFAIKYAADRVLAGTLVVLTAPVILGVALGVLATLGRPVFFRQRRIGRDGREFEMLKFRTMRAKVEPEELAVDLPPDTAPGGVEGEDRRTRLGSFLRGTSLDELPQLLNVLKGDMSLIGPRPERPHFVGLFEQSVYRYGDRHRVKSGITGWAQVNGLRGKTSLADRVEWDNYYIENWSLWLDLKIALLTAVAVLRFSRQVE
jgi:exopolysaccharide biosynthesis polyprenyl glycosylphosphotransferase